MLALRMLERDEDSICQGSSSNLHMKTVMPSHRGILNVCSSDVTETPV